MGIRRRRRLRDAAVALSTEGMCRYVRARIVSPETDGGLVNASRLRIEYVHQCKENCAWLDAKLVVMEVEG